jgi:hypothetical protein
VRLSLPVCRACRRHKNTNTGFRTIFESEPRCRFADTRPDVPCVWDRWHKAKLMLRRFCGACFFLKGLSAVPSFAGDFSCIGYSGQAGYCSSSSSLSSSMFCSFVFALAGPEINSISSTGIASFLPSSYSTATS